MKKLMYFLVLVLFTASLGYSQVTTLWENSAATSNLPAWFTTGNGERGLAYGSVAGNDRVYIVSRNSTFGNNIYIYNATNGDSVGLLNNTGISGGLFIINDVEVSSNGVIFVSNMTTDASGATNPFKVYRYDAETDIPVTVISYNTTGVVRLGDKFTVTGSTADNSVTIWAASGNTKELYKFTTTDNGLTFTPTIIQLPSLGTVSLGSAAVGPLPNGDFYYNAGGQPAQKFLADGTVIDTVSTGIIATGTNAIRFMSTPTTDEFFATYAYGPTNETGRIVKIPGGDLNLAELVGVTPILGTNSNAGGTGDLSIQLVSPFIYNVYVLGTNNGFGAYQVDLRTPLAGDYYIPQGANPQGFPTLADAVASLNVNGALGTVNFLLDADTLRENTFTFDADLSVDNNVVIKPAPGRDVVLFVTAGPSQGNGIQMIGFNKGYVTFDGSNDGSNSRNLTISTEQDAVAVPFGLNNANADTVALKNLMIKNIVDVPLNFRYGAVINDVGGVFGFHVENCQIGTPEKPVRRDGLAPWGGGATPNSFTFLNNEIYAGVRGITTIYLIDSEIRGNTINLIPTGLTGGTDAYNHGIYITGGQGSIDINENVINCLTKTTNASSYMIGIAFAGNSEGGTDWINIFNNMINIGAADETRSTYGIGLRSSLPMGNLKIYHNTIVTNDNASTLVSYGVGNHTNGTGAVNIDLKNNIIINNHNGNTGSSVIGLIPATSVLVSDYNNLYSTQNLVNFTGTLYADLTAWQATSQDLNSVSKLVNFVSATDLHLTGASIGDFDLAGTGMTEVPFDIDGDLRDANFPYMGADEGNIPLGVITIAEAREDLNGDLIPDRLGQVVTIQGVVISPNYQTTNHSYYIWDGTAGITEILFGTTNPVLNLGDLVSITGEIGQFRGLTQIQPAASSNITFLSAGNPVPGPVVLSIADYMADPEAYEGTLVGFIAVNKVSGTWPSPGGSATIKVTDGTDTVDIRIDSDTDLDDNPEPVWPADLLGLGSQFSSGTTVLDDGYQILPRYYATDILPPGTIPVELTSFTASVVNGNVTLSWTTASETNNRGFEIERSTSGEFAVIGFVEGSGTSLQEKTYSYVDPNLASGTYSYRLKQIDLNGSFEYSGTVEVDVTAPTAFELAQNYPNPFNPATVIEYSIASPVNVTLTVYTILGEQVAVLVNNQFTEAGKYSVNFNASSLASGTYIYRLHAGEFVSVKKMLLAK